MEEESSISPGEETTAMKISDKTKAMLVVIFLGLLAFVWSFVSITYNAYNVARHESDVAWLQIMRRLLHNPNILFTLLIPVTIFAAVYRKLTGWFITMSIYYYTAINMVFAFLSDIYEHYAPKYIVYTGLMSAVSVIAIIFLNKPGVRFFYKIASKRNRLKDNIVSILLAAGIMVVYIILRVYHHWIDW